MTLPFVATRFQWKPLPDFTTTNFAGMAHSCLGTLPDDSCGPTSNFGLTPGGPGDAPPHAQALPCRAPGSRCCGSLPIGAERRDEQDGRDTDDADADHQSRASTLRKTSPAGHRALLV